MKVVRITCKGRVQGVFFRDSTRSRARNLELSGWVRNEANGDVLIHAQGEELAINDLVEWCHEGPTHADVTSVTVDVAEEEVLTGFEVRRY